MNTNVPDWVKDSLARYVDHKIETGSFLRAVLENDLFEAINRADIESLAALPNIVRYIYNYIRSDCYGDQRKVSQWLNQTTIMVSDGYKDIIAEPAKEGYLVIRGDGRVLPENSFIWNIEHGNTGWMRCDDGFADKNYIYSVPKN